eukprot:CAMPEP_0114576740 /NCGR_PEP_ID=MMETSP0125-20121206/1472_1 /TAXON_ID=485358 ORGANISM="Aristerostoma sp., Strain ATCC 50986" /NCGR_SAMPLE_ID=MMETSP0125 /ASSEMBLY_ACC=CAM_ASM_000245 /LENGTH=113 /DNA_ID=CAMNT_0001765497 /DNA_START=120 /DNA_END=461 /DNA_ORIENTATION=+
MERHQKDGKLQKISYILMEYANNGDFQSFLNPKNPQIDEKLSRTYFHQLIAGISYLHSHCIAHLDIKPENLLLGDDLQLKIADFDLAYFEGDEMIKSGGTPCFRAPELITMAQ